MDTSKKSIIELVKNNEELFKIICSTHYHFTNDEIRKYWDKLIKGNAFYSVYIDDNEGRYQPDYGLCWNSNIEWDDWLKGHWHYNDPNDNNKPKNTEGKMSIGFFDPFRGLNCDGAYKVPLNISRQNGSYYWDCFSDFLRKEEELEGYHLKEEELIKYYGKEELQETREDITIAKGIFHRNYGELSFKTISGFLNGPNKFFYADIMITKKEIWDKSLSKWIDSDIIKILFG